AGQRLQGPVPRWLLLCGGVSKHEAAFARDHLRESLQVPVPCGPGSQRDSARPLG
ncbi:unnamed protein product, partial [Effrenium voratum]